MCYKLKNVFSGELHLGDEMNPPVESGDITFILEEDVDTNFPAILIIYATDIDFQRNRVALNGNFLGYLNVYEKGHIFEIDNKKKGKLRKPNISNKVTIMSCDQWGDRKQEGVNIDDIRIKGVDICYKPQ